LKSFQERCWRLTKDESVAEKSRKIALGLIIMSTLWAGAGYPGWLCSAAAAETVGITTVDELFTYAGIDGSYAISSSGGDGNGKYDLSTRTGGGSDLKITGNWNLGIAGTGNVTIDGANLYKVIFDDDGSAMTSTISGSDENNRIIFQRGDDETVRVQSTTADVTVIFDYCDFTEADTYGGLNLNATGAAGEIEVTCNDCNATANEDDGFCIGGTGNSEAIILNLNNCISHDNGGESNDQGVTAHGARQYINIDGGEYYNNHGQGIAMMGGSQLSVRRADFHDNGGADIHCEDPVTAAEIEGCDFHSYENRTAIRAHGWLIKVSNSRFYDAKTGTCVAILADRGFLSVSNCTFSGFNTGLSKGISLIPKSVGAEISYNTFYNMASCISISSAYGATVKGNIFHTTSSYGIMTTEQQYQKNAANGYNYFYNCAYDFYDSVLIFGSQLHSTDVADVNPLLADPAGGDFHLQSAAGRWNPAASIWTNDINTSPGIDAGEPNADWTGELWPNGRRKNVGAYGGTAQASMSLSPAGNKADFNHDGMVDSEDLASFVERWLVEDILLPQDINHDNQVNARDFAEFLEEWLGQE